MTNLSAQKKIGLTHLLIAFLGFSLVFNPWVIPVLPQNGWLSVLISPQVFFLLAFVWIVWARNLPREKWGLSVQPFGLNTLRGLSLGLFPIFFALSVFLFFELVGLKDLWLGPPIPYAPTAKDYLLLFLLAPLSEELFFRGLLFPALKEEYSTRFAVIASAVIFMAGHGGVKIGPLILGLITPLLYLRTKSLWPGMLFHAISNTYIPLLITFFPNLYRKILYLF